MKKRREKKRKRKVFCAIFFFNQTPLLSHFFLSVFADPIRPFYITFRKLPFFFLGSFSPQLNFFVIFAETIQQKMSSTSTSTSTSTSSGSARGGPRQQQQQSTSRNGGGGGGGNRSSGYPHIQHTRTQQQRTPAPSAVDPIVATNAKAKAKEQLVQPQLPISSAVAGLLLTEDQAVSARPSASASPAVSGAGQVCIVCCEPVEYCSLGICNHHEVCHVCSLRLRSLYKNNSCSFCKACSL